VICTTLDSLNLARVTEKTGTDTRDVLALMDQYSLTLQVEDPAEAWGATPTRYTDYGRIYKKLVSDPNKLMFDINVVHDPSRTQSPTEFLSGTELALAVRSAAEAGNGRVGVYSESSVGSEDRSLIPIVLGGQAGPAASPTLGPGRSAELTEEANDTARVATITALGTVRLRLDSRLSTGGPIASHQTSGKPPVLDGDIWPCGSDGEILVPAGQHTLGGVPREQAFIDRLRVIGSRTAVLKDITAEIQQVNRTSLGLAIDYRSPRRAWAVLAREPIKVRIDGAIVERPVMTHHDGEWIIQLPAGNRRVEIDDETVPAAAVDAASAVSSRTIVWFGQYFVLALLVAYVGVHCRRFAGRALGRALPTRPAAQGGISASPPKIHTGPLSVQEEAAK